MKSDHLVRNLLLLLALDRLGKLEGKPSSQTDRSLTSSSTIKTNFIYMPPLLIMSCLARVTVKQIAA